MSIYMNIPPAPESYTAENVCVRLIDSIGFRYIRAVEGLEEKHNEFHACEGSMSIIELQSHIFGLIKWVHGSILSVSTELEFSNENMFLLLKDMREALLGGQVKLADLSIGGKPFWSAINGPLADALTHIGQINLLKRAAQAPPTTGGYFV